MDGRNTAQPTAVIVIPARLGSTRLAEKLLLCETGKSVLQHTYEQAIQSRLASRVLIATDHEKILAESEKFQGEAVMTDPDAMSGTDRVAQVAEELDEFDIIVNVQGDEPELDPSHIDLAISRLAESPSHRMATLAAPIRSKQQWHDPACVKVVLDSKGDAIYFSRLPIPFARDNTDAQELCEKVALQHIGLYAYRRDFLLTIAAMPPTKLELTERLEQLRVLELGYSIAVAKVEHSCGGIDTLEDYQAFVQRYRTIHGQAA